MISLVMRGWIPRRVADTEADMAPEDLISVISVISSKAFLAADSAIPEEVIPMLRVRDEMYKRQSPLTFLKHAKELKSRFRYSEWRTAVSVQAPDRLRAAARKRVRTAADQGRFIFNSVPLSERLLPKKLVPVVREREKSSATHVKSVVEQEQYAFLNVWKLRYRQEIHDGQVLTVRGQGDAGSEQAVASGDLNVSITESRPDVLFKRDGYDIWCEGVPITYMQACLGDEIDVPTIDGAVKQIIKEGTQPGTVIQLRGRGVQNLNEEDAVISI